MSNIKTAAVTALAMVAIFAGLNSFKNRDAEAFDDVPGRVTPFECASTGQRGRLILNEGANPHAVEIAIDATCAAIAEPEAPEPVMTCFDEHGSATQGDDWKECLAITPAYRN